MRAVFADTGYWIAISNPRDALHLQAKAVSRALSPVRLVTSETVLTEYLNDFGQRGEFLRRTAVRLTERLRRDPNTTIVRQTSPHFGPHWPCTLHALTRPGVTPTAPRSALWNATASPRR